MSIEAARRNARRGADLLDRKKPGWRKKIILERLDMASGGFNPERRSSCGCILAQTSDSHNYSIGLGELDLSFENEQKHGFNQGEGASYAELKEAWTEIVSAGA